MTRPTLKINRYCFRYIQVLYDDRYFVVEYNELGQQYHDDRWTEVARIPGRCMTVVNDLIQAACKDEDRSEQIDRFLHRVEQHDHWLDRHDRAELSR